MQIIIFVADHFGVREITIFVHLCTVDCPKFCVLKIQCFVNWIHTVTDHNL